MATFENAFYKQDKLNIDIKTYNDKAHKGNIYCPECFLAPLHIVRKEKKVPYFASNRKDEHNTDCQHYEEFITNKKITKLVDSKDIEDAKRLNFLVENNLRSAINLLLEKDIIKKETKTSTKTLTTRRKTKNNTNTYKQESIQRVSIKNLYKKKESLLNNYIIIWGEAKIESKTIKENNFKSLIFRIDEKFRFSIPLTKNLIKYYKELSSNPTNTRFAVFGLLQENNKGFLNLKIRTTKHINYL